MNEGASVKCPLNGRNIRWGGKSSLKSAGPCTWADKGHSQVIVQDITVSQCLGSARGYKALAE